MGITGFISPFLSRQLTRQVLLTRRVDSHMTRTLRSPKIASKPRSIMTQPRLLKLTLKPPLMQLNHKKPYNLLPWNCSHMHSIVLGLPFQWTHPLRTRRGLVALLRRRNGCSMLYPGIRRSSSVYPAYFATTSFVSTILPWHLFEFVCCTTKYRYRPLPRTTAA